MIIGRVLVGFNKKKTHGNKISNANNLLAWKLLELVNKKLKVMRVVIERCKNYNNERF